MGGILWHTQGSGKTLTMVWLAKWILTHWAELNARVLIVTDRDELDEQIEKTFTGVDENIARTKSGKDLLNRLNVYDDSLICSLVHKFGRRGGEATENDYDKYIEELKASLPANFEAKGNLVVFVDECHRTQSGKLHTAMKTIMPNAVFIGFTGTPLLKKDKKTAQVPIIFITAKDTENDTVTGFNLGADDYISKPFSLREVAARVKAVLRRTRQGETEHAPEQIVYKTLVLDIIKKKVCIDGEEAPLTKKEFEILLLLLQNKGRVFSREDILNRIWSDEVYVLDRTIDVNITRLRKKIGVYGKCIVTRLGYGYCFEAE